MLFAFFFYFQRNSLISPKKSKKKSLDLMDRFTCFDLAKNFQKHFLFIFLNFWKTKIRKINKKMQNENPDYLMLGIWSIFIHYSPWDSILIQNIKLAIENVKKAVQFDNQSKYAEALNEYEIALEHLFSALNSKILLFIFL